MSLYSDFKKVDKLLNPENKKVYYITDEKNEAIHPLIESFTLDDIWDEFSNSNRNLRLKISETDTVFVDVDTENKEELDDFMKLIRGLSFIKIKSPKKNHYHIIFKVPTSFKLVTPYTFSKNITVWDPWVAFHNTCISLGPTLPSLVNNREFLIIPEHLDELPNIKT